MIFGIILAAVFLAIVFFHYVQGFFSSMLSAILAVIAAVFAFSYHETIAESLLQGKAANLADSMVLVVLFAAIYLILRVIFDKVVPGGVMLPAMADRIGGAVMGAIAAACCVGILAIAAEEMPLGPAVLGFANYDSADGQASIPGALMGHSQSQEGFKNDELQIDDPGRFDEARRSHTFPWLLGGVDDFVVSTVSHLSDNGSLQNGQPLTAVHPDFLQELYGQRAGIQAGASHVAVNVPSLPEPAVMFAGPFTLDWVRVTDSELKTVRDIHTPKNPLKIEKHIAYTYKRSADQGKQTDYFDYCRASVDPVAGSEKQILVVVRIIFGLGASDPEDGIVRFSPASVRLVASKPNDSGVLVPTDYYPLGTLEKSNDPVKTRDNQKLPDGDGGLLYLDKLDDYLFVPVKPAQGKAGVDMLFLVDKNGVVGKDNRIDAGVFVEFKRMSRKELGGSTLTQWDGVAPGIILGVLHKVPAELPAEMLPLIAPTTETAPTTQSAAPAAPTGPPEPMAGRFQASKLPHNLPVTGMDRIIGRVEVLESPQLSFRVGVPAAGKLVDEPGFKALMIDGAFQELIVDPRKAMSDLSKYDMLASQVAIPAGQTLWQVIFDTPADPWSWLEKLPDMTFVDSNDAQTKVSGFWAIVNDNGVDKLYARYDPAHPITAESLKPFPTGNPTRIALAFLVPKGAGYKQIKLKGELLKDLRLQ